MQVLFGTTTLNGRDGLTNIGRCVSAHITLNRISLEIDIDIDIDVDIGI